MLTVRLSQDRTALNRAWSSRGGEGSWWDGTVRPADRDVEERDAREMRGEPPDMTGWLLW